MSVLGQTAGIERMKKAGKQASMMRTSAVAETIGYHSYDLAQRFGQRIHSISHEKRSV